MQYHSLKYKQIYSTFLLCLLWFFSLHNSKAEKHSLDSLPFYNGPDFTPMWISPMSEEYEQIHTIISFSFTNQENQIISSKTLDGKIYVANFIYTSCGGLCPKMTQNMALVQKAFKDDSEVVLLSHTVTPDIDTSSILKSYAISYGAMPEKWHFLRGSKKEIYQIARTSYFADKDIGFKRDENDFLHTENFILVDHRRRIRGVYNGSLTLDMKRLVQDIETLKEESSLKSISHKR